MTMQQEAASAMTVDETESITTMQEDRASSPTSEETTTPCEDAKATATEDVVFTPVYNGAVTPVHARDTARVTTLLQKGMKFEHMAADLEKLHRLAAMCGTASVGETIDRLVAEKEQARHAAYVSRFGEEAAQQLLARERAGQGDFADADAAADEASREALGLRLATEFGELQEHHPQIMCAQDLPREVLLTAAQRQIPLLDAYNRHILQEQQRVASAAQQQAVNQTATTGSLSGAVGETLDPVWEAFMRGAARAMR